MKEKISEILDGIVHPETGEGLVQSGMVADIDTDGAHIFISLRFRKRRDPFAAKLVRTAEQALRAAFPDAEVVVRQQEAPKREEPARETRTDGIRRIIAVASGKGGVGKSTVTANLAAALRDMGFRVGILDADIYGPSQPKIFGCEGYVPEAERDGDTDIMIPAEVGGIKLMSIGFFVRPTDALLWRGPMAVNALRQMIHQTRWGELDYLLTDLPPGTGDIHLSIIGELKIDGAVIVSTPQQIAVADVVRGVDMFRNPQVGIPVLGIVENMAWFTPRELPDNRYYIFGHGGAARYAETCGVDFLGEIPIIQSVMEDADSGRTILSTNAEAAEYYRRTAAKVVDKCR